jgi:hypothetical protein
LKSAEEGTGPQENVERFRQKIRDLEAEQARFGSLKPGEKYCLEQRDVADLVAADIAPDGDRVEDVVPSRGSPPGPAASLIRRCAGF